MDKIDSVGESFAYKQLKKKSGQKKSGKVNKFSSLLNRIEETGRNAEMTADEENFADDLNELLDDISDFGEELSKHPTLQNIKQYKEKVKQFIAYLVRNNLEVQEKTSGGNIMKRKKYMVINIIDGKLEELAKVFLMGQADSLKILEKVEEINGLLIDLIQ
ncbi:MAG: YaaR family protein [Spirochaetales bacterium]|nr:YaaR family protein [Spirochaetales bacterium]